jgi:hypothetical protein
VKTAQGNNRPAAEVIEVSSTPITPETPAEWQSLPLWLDTKIEDTANSRARDIAPKLRRLLGAPSFSSAWEALGDSISGHELIHTSYFDHPEVLDLLTMHMGRSRGDAQWLDYRKTQHPDLVAWLDAFYEANLRAGGEQPKLLAGHHTTQLPVRPHRRSRPTAYHEPPKQDAA